MGVICHTVIREQRLIWIELDNNMILRHENTKLVDMKYIDCGLARSGGNRLLDQGNVYYTNKKRLRDKIKL